MAPSSVSPAPTGEQVDLANRIAAVEASIATVKDANPGSLPEDMPQTQRLIERTLSALRDAQRQLDIAKSDEAFWSNQAANAAAGGSGTGDVSPARRLQVLELHLDALRAQGFTDKHPDIKITLQEIAEVRESIRLQGEKGDAEIEPTNQVQRSALASQTRAQNSINASRAEIARHQEALDRLNAQLEATPRVAEQLDALFRDHRNLTVQLADFNNRRLEAEVAADLERRQLGEQFRVLEPAFPPPSPSSPNRIVILVVAFMIGMSLGVAAAVVAESADSSVHGPQQLQSDVGIPVLASIPTILLQPDLVARRRRWMRNLAAAVGVTFFMVAGGVVTYIIVNGAAGGAAEEVSEDEREEALDLLREPGKRKRGDAGAEDPEA